jgi:hypothetical protein
MGDRTASAIDLASQLQAAEEGIAGHKSGCEEEEEGYRRLANNIFLACSLNLIPR